MTHPIKAPKKLIEVALPLDKINVAAAREKSIRHGHPSTLHLWWARRPLAAARAVIFAQLVNDPSGRWELEHPGEVPPPNLRASWAASRKRLFDIIEKLVQWENTTNETVLDAARKEIQKSWREVCELNADHPDAATLFNPERMPGLHDPFAGGGTIPLEAQRLGLEAFASDLNPVAVLINKAMIEIPPRFAGQRPVHPDAQNEAKLKNWQGAQGLAEDVRRYGAWMRDEAFKRIGHLYPPVTITPELARERSDLKDLVGQKLTVIAWLWARTVKSPHPVFSHVDVPLASTFILSSKEGKESYVEPVVNGDRYEFHVRKGSPPASAKGGTKLARGANFACLLSGAAIEPGYIKAAGMAKQLGARLMAIVAEGERGRVYLNPTQEMEELAHSATPDWQPSLDLPNDPRAFWTVNYGLTTYGDLFTPRQLVALTTFSDLVGEAREKCYQDALARPLLSPKTPLSIHGEGLGGEVPITGHAHVSPLKLARAREFRRLPTDAEAAAWELLRDRRCLGLKFRRQQVIQGFIVDFYCAERRLALELDGEIHNQPEQMAYDLARDEALNKAGVTVVRLQNGEVSKAVLEGILGTSPPPLSINGEGRRMEDEELGLNDGGSGARAYAEAVGVYLGLSISKLADTQSSLCRWKPSMDQSISTFGRQALPMVWDYSEANAFGEMAGDPIMSLNNMMRVLDSLGGGAPGEVRQVMAQTQELSQFQFLSTDPPYYDNIGYADLSDFFYVWLRRTLRDTFPDIFATLAVPKAEELVATPYRHGSKDSAEAFFLSGMTLAMSRIANQAHPSAPMTIYYAFKQSETSETDGTTSPGWVTFLEAVGKAGLAVTGTWPMRTELGNRMISSGTNALASSIVLVCRKRPANAKSISRRAFIRELHQVLPQALEEMINGADADRSPVAPVDLSQAIIGPGMAVFSKYAAVLEADGSPMPVKTALQLINRFLAESDFDADTQFCTHWFETHGWNEGPFGEADVLARAKATSVSTLVAAGVVDAGGGRVRLLRWTEYPSDWDPQRDARLADWEILHHLIRLHRQQGDTGAGQVLARVAGRIEAVRLLAFRLYTLCERQGWAEDARAYNLLVTSWQGIEEVANATPVPEGQLTMFTPSSGTDKKKGAKK